MPTISGCATRLQEQCGAAGLVPGLKRVAREYAVATYVTVGPIQCSRMRAVESRALCLLVAAAACEFLLPGAGSLLVVAERLSAVVALVVSS